MNQLSNYYTIKNPLGTVGIYAANKGDFYLEEKYSVEVGGKNKSFKQIKDMPNSFLACDDIEVGHGSKIPLWMFGFLY